MAFTGGCQCGRMRYSAEGPRDRSSVCYCRMCQKAGGAPFMAFVRFPAARVSWSAPPATFASSEAVERGFCSACGTPLSYRDTRGTDVSLTIYSLDDPGAVDLEFCFSPERKPPWLDALEDLRPVDLQDGPALASLQHPDRPD
ncbi:GFA family protein [Lichenibacterium dinghuense]|uniref:GFA family protein n=1 Tax=Lichenibacterium dinghuense TaxID=2895977 RepID=UPI001F3EADBB|nr:GFA family protein [Lichenibacterium sp. 6Y81]